ncbi:uncharacterized protein LOC119718825 [Patiria miniata]|uniref:EF-hand domain-containing protein n=1 Tax=Patiria miniata TaxID=46514 RepID=A0A913YXS9_PATMI|nr:uncharacterized protein LOC119718825 [Patiria miniata]
MRQANHGHLDSTDHHRNHLEQTVNFKTLAYRSQYLDSTMARFVLSLLIAGLVASADGQWGGTQQDQQGGGTQQDQQGGGTQQANPIQDVIDTVNRGWEISPGVTVRPTFDPGSVSVGIEVRIEFKRSVSQPTKEGAFSLLDIDGNGALSVEEWHAHEGGVVNFTAFLKSVDTDGNEEISWAEFQTVNRVYTKN